MITLNILLLTKLAVGAVDVVVSTDAGVVFVDKIDVASNFVVVLLVSMAEEVVAVAVVVVDVSVVLTTKTAESVVSTKNGYKYSFEGNRIVKYTFRKQLTFQTTFFYKKCIK